ncbi:MAG TPA: hypothetical protein H9784_07855 [Candidatus Desulfovibrio intestinavium]|uniref:Uncharacterized protein n=1 Tax=Candidatus Desulfovibrio intestinavium TaxID=2838534 RepID=A0A9D2HM26_9BACT|nr:hypothetical protein [Candidatus Desulfovibrio intestinavium]
MSAPAWFNYATYVANKLAQLQSADPEAGWTSESLQAAFTAAGYSNDADGMYQHFVDWGNAENVSPSPYFVVSEYMANKLAQLQSAEPAAGWDMTKLEQAFKDAGLSAWDHYTLYGQDEGISPSSLFDNNAYLSAKLAQLQSAQPDAGWESVDQVVDAFQAAGLNPIEHYMLYGVSEALTYTPVAPVDPETPVTNELTVDRDVLNLGAGDHVIGGVASALSAEKTLNENDLIDGGDGNDTLRVTMNGNFNGFTVTDNPDTTGGMTNVENVELINNGSIGRTFSAKGIEGATTYTLKAGDSGIGAINLKDLSAAGITVNVDGLKSGTTSVQFASDALSGTEDSLTLGLTNVGTAPAADGDPTSVNVKTTSGLESVTINASGPNYVNLVDVDATSLAMTGSGALTIAEVNAALETFDGSAATGNVTADLTGADEIKSIVGTQGDDTFTVKSLSAVATLEGGAGNDTLWLNGFNGTLQPTVSGFETIGAENGSNLTLSGKNAQDFTAVSLRAGTVTLAKLNASAFTVNSLGTTDFATTANNATLTDAVQLTVNVEAAAGADATQTIMSTVEATNATDAVINVGANVLENGAFTFAKAQSVQLNVTGNEGISDELAGFNAKLVASAATDLTVTAGADVTLLDDSKLNKVESLSLTQNDGAFNVGNATLDALSSLTITGSGKESAATFAALGSDKNTYRLNVTADGLAAGLTLGAVVTQDDVTLDFDNVTGNVTVGAITGDDVSVLVSRLGEQSTIGNIRATGNVTVEATDNLAKTGLNIGTITVGGENVNANAAVSVILDGSAALTVGNIDASVAEKSTVTFDISDHTKGITTTSTISGNTVNVYGSELAANEFTGITANTLDFTGGLGQDSVTLAASGSKTIKATLDTGADDDTVTINGAATTETITVSGDMGGDAGDNITITAAANKTTGVNIDISKLADYAESEITGSGDAKAANASIKDTIIAGDGNDTINIAADVVADHLYTADVTLGGGDDTISYTVATGGKSVVNVTGFVEGDEIEDFTAATLTNAAGAATALTALLGSTITAADVTAVSDDGKVAFYNNNAYLFSNATFGNASGAVCLMGVTVGDTTGNITGVDFTVTSV